MKLISIIKKTNTNKSNYFDNIDTLKHFPSSVREWNNSIFMFNKNALPLIPNVYKLAIKFIINYFKLHNKKIEGKIRRYRILRSLSFRIRKLSSSKIFISKGEFKHTNNKVTITLYLFNRQKKNYLLKLKKIYFKKFFKRIKVVSIKAQNKFNFRTINLFQKRKFIGLFKQSYHSYKWINYKKKIKIKNLLDIKLTKIKIKGLLALKKTNREKRKIINVLKGLKKNSYKFKGISDYVNNFYKKLIKKSIRKMENYIYLRQLIFINESKFNYTYLQYLKNHLQILFNKNVEFNFINLKQFFLNSNILSESIMLKITRNRRKLYPLLKNLKKKVGININKKKVSLVKLFNKKNLNTKNYFYKNPYNLQKFIIKKLKYRHITGFRLEAKGRLNRRYTAARSINKLIYQGNLLNINSSYKGLSSVLLKGNLNPNVQYTKLNSKSRIGSFGIKGWVSGY